jgi:acyl-CoA thioesterase-1
MPDTIVVALLATLLLVACGQPAAPPASVAPERASGEVSVIVAFGDSLTSGYGINDPDRDAWPALLEQELRRRGWNIRVANAGVSGNTTADALARVNFSVPDGTRLVIVALGANDTFRGKKLDEIESNLDAILAQIRARGATALLCEMKTFPNLGPFYARGFERLFPALAKKHDAIPVPFFLEGVATVPAMNQADGIHPNEAGHRKIAENLLPFVEKGLRSGS